MFYLCRIIGVHAPQGMVEVFLDLAGVGKEFITSHLEFDTSTNELTLP